MTQVKLRRLDYKPLDFTATKVDLEIKLDLPVARVKNKIAIKRLNPQASSFVLNGQKLDLLALKINGQDWDKYTLDLVSEVDGFQNLTVDVSSLADASEFTLEVLNEFNLEENESMSGIYLSDQVIVSQCEAEGFRRISFYFDRPDCLAEFTTTIEAKKAYKYLLSNGNLIASGEVDQEWHYAKWHDPFPKPSYLFACVAGNFDLLEDTFVTKSGRQVQLKLFAEPGRLEQIKFAMQAIKRAMKWDEDRFGLEYDLDVFMIVGVGYFNAGAMENKGLNIFNDELLVGCKDTSTDNSLFLIDSVIAHEYFHNWTGDRVTCRDWFQLTLKEGLTVFRDQEYSSDTLDRTVKRIQDAATIQQYQFNEDKGPLSHPIRPDEVESQDNFYTSTVYEKGAEVIRLLHTLIGEENFQKGMKLYFARHDGKAVTCDDFVDAMADASGYNLDHFRLWYSQSGTPVVKVSSNYNADTKTQTLVFKQHTPPTFDQKEKQPLTLALKTQFLTADGRTLTNLESKDGNLVPEVIVFETEQYELELVNVPEELVVVTNLDFTSPVKIEQDLTSADLANIAANCQNFFAKYNAIRTYLNNIVAKNEAKFAQDPRAQLELDQDFKAIYGNLFAQARENASITAEILSLHNTSSLTGNAEKAYNPHAYNSISRAIEEKLCADYHEQLFQLYQELPFREWEYNAKHFGERALRRELIKILSRKPEYEYLVAELYDKATCFTDKFAALTAVFENNLTGLFSLKERYIQEYQEHTICLDRLLGLEIRSARSIEQVKEAVENAKQFSYTKPNSIYLLIGELARNYSLSFTYEWLDFLKELLIQVDKYNPGVSPHICRIFTEYNLYVEPYRSKLLNVIKELLSSQIQFSRNALEILTKGLQASEA
ncbi:aminopeptidase N [Psittacicella melopsittaci]|uniref:Aminopeptidase N n=1 Tax=Psittacicella melopsittaci TaxID=2028576 RepID=A0A3A1Y4N9_9GAMM|nr:aminopeptidase N [Psittacicella melopsittaci]RIY32421.1 aminopeptidase N [Psittacicella melopsittaci]